MPTTPTERWSERGFDTYAAAARWYRQILEHAVKHGARPGDLVADELDEVTTTPPRNTPRLPFEDLVWLIKPWMSDHNYRFTFASNGRNHKNPLSNFSFALLDGHGGIRLFSVTKALRGKKPFYTF